MISTSKDAQSQVVQQFSILNEKNNEVRPGSFDSVVPVSSDPGDEGGGGDKNKNDENLKIGFNHHN